MRLPSHSKPERNAALVSAYEKGALLTDLSKLYGITASRVCRIIHRYGKPRTSLEWQRRGGAGPGRKPVWGDCPEYLRERYEKAKKRMGAHAAKEMIQRQERSREQIARFGPVA